MQGAGCGCMGRFYGFALVGLVLHASRSFLISGFLIFLFCAPVAAEETVLLEAEGPWGGLIHGLTYGPHEGKDALFALTSVGVFRFDAEASLWKQENVLSRNAPAPVMPFLLHHDHLEGREGLYRPGHVSWSVGEDALFLKNQANVLYRAERGGAGWQLFDPLEKGRPVSLASFAGREGGGAFWLQGADEAEGKSALWSWSPSAKAWSSREMAGRAVLASEGSATRGAAWTEPPSMVPLEGAGSLVTSFVRVRGGEAKVFPWADRLQKSVEVVRRGCRDALGLLDPGGGSGESSVLVAIGERTLCVSADGGEAFFPRRDFLSLEDKISSAVAFVWPEAPLGVRILVGTRARLDQENPTKRARGGRLFLSDDGGETWEDATPDIEAPGGVISLVAGSGDEGTEVWMLTGRQGAFRSRVGGRGFRRESGGIGAVPIFDMVKDPNIQDEVWAATPVGLYNFGSSWKRAGVMATRSLGAEPASSGHLGQLWAGSGFGVVSWRNQRGSWVDEKLPPRDFGEFQDLRWARGASHMVQGEGRPVSAVSPGGFDASGDMGYALVDGEGLWRRSGGSWRPVRFPGRGEGTLRVLEMLSLPLESGEMGIVVVVSGDKRASLWLHDPTRGWSSMRLPAKKSPVAAVKVGKKLWVSSVSGQVFEVGERQGQLFLGNVLGGNYPCRRMLLRRDRSVECFLFSETSEAGEVGFLPKRALMESVNFPLALLNGREDASGLPRRVWAARNPRGRNFAHPRGLAWSVNDVGEHLWVSPRYGAFAEEQALVPELPYEIKEEQPAFDESVRWVVIGVVVCLIVFPLFLWFGPGRRKRLRERVMRNSPEE